MTNHLMEKAVKRKPVDGFSPFSFYHVIMYVTVYLWLFMNEVIWNFLNKYITSEIDYHFVSINQINKKLIKVLVV